MPEKNKYTLEEAFCSLEGADAIILKTLKPAEECVSKKFGRPVYQFLRKAGSRQVWWETVRLHRFAKAGLITEETSKQIEARMISMLVNEATVKCPPPEGCEYRYVGYITEYYIEIIDKNSGANI